MTTQPPPALPSTSNGLATCSLICGIAGFLTGPLTGIVAIITGHAAQKRIRQSGGVVGGSGAATTGLVLGYVTTVLSIFVIGLAALATPQIYQALQRANMVENVNEARMLKLLLDDYATDYDGNYPADLNDLAGDPHTRDFQDHDYTQPKTKTKLSWLYFPGQTNTSNYGNIILASPETVDFRGGAGRIVVRIDGSTEVIPERDYQSQIRRQSTPTP